MKRGVALFLSPLLLVAIINGCGDSGGSPPTGSTPTGPTTGSGDPSLTAPSPQTPVVGGMVDNVQPQLTVANSVGGSGARTYAFEVAMDSGFTQIVASEGGVREGLGGVTNWMVVEQLTADMQYFWRARANTSAGAGPFSTTANFRVRGGFRNDRASGGIAVFDPLNNGGSVGEVVGGRFLDNGWQATSHTDCIRYNVPTLQGEGLLEFETTNVSSPNPAPGKRMLVSMWDPSKGDYTTNAFRMHLQKLDESTAKFNDVRFRWISRGQEANTGISFYDFEPQIVYSWRIEWGTFPGIPNAQHVKVFLDGFEILTRNYDKPYTPNPHWVELGNCDRGETLEQAIWSNVRIGTR